MTKRNLTPEQRAAWNLYMREYRARRKAGETGPRDFDRPLEPTPRQIEILRAYADPSTGGSQRAVAEALGISVSAVHNQLQRLMKRIGVRDPSQAVMKLWVNENGTSSEIPPAPAGQATPPGRGRPVLPPRKADRA